MTKKYNPGSPQAAPACSSRAFFVASASGTVLKRSRKVWGFVPSNPRNVKNIFSSLTFIPRWRLKFC